MLAIIDIAPRGDIVVAVGKETDQKIARVSSVLLQLASPVFDTMLGPLVHQL